MPKDNMKKLVNGGSTSQHLENERGIQARLMAVESLLRETQYKTPDHDWALRRDKLLSTPYHI